MGAIEVPVLIVGGGGTGLSASVFLSDHGVGHLVGGDAVLCAEDRTRRPRTVQVRLPDDLGAATPLADPSGLSGTGIGKERSVPHLTAVA